MQRLLAFLFVLVFSITAFAQSHTLSYQGQLNNAVGDPVSASYPMAFSLYADADGGEAVWSESWDGVEVVDGVFTVDEIADRLPATIGDEEMPMFADLERRMKEMAEKKAAEEAAAS